MMTIIFYNPQDKQLYVCSTESKMQVLDPNDPQLMTYIPDDDILYVQNGHMITRGQFSDWMEGKMDLVTPNYRPPQDHGFDSGFRFEQEQPQNQRFAATKEEYQQQVNRNSLFIHPCHPGTIIIQDIISQKYPHGVEINGKWNFVALDDIGGEEALEESHVFKYLHAKGKVEIVNADFVQKNKHRHRAKSPGDAALDAILIPGDRPGTAERVWSEGGMITSSSLGGDSSVGNGPVEIFVE